jgi:hypothetical protein
VSQLPPIDAPTKVHVSQLGFDPINPRFTPDMDVDTRSPADVVRELDRRADLGELLQSIAESGYVDIEPLVVLEDNGRLLVLEGNRRLAALKLPLDPALAAEAGIKVPPMEESKRASLREVTVFRVADRKAAQDFIGFKHINGPHRWDSLAKARFAAHWFLRERNAGSGVTLRDIARRMGDRHDTIKRMVAGYFVLKQAEKQELYDTQDRYPSSGPLPFSHLYIGITRPPIRDFLGLKDETRSDDPQPEPVPAEHLPNLGRLMGWLFGSKQDERPPIVMSQNPHVRQLAEVLGNKAARAMLMAQDNLKAAYAQVEKPTNAFEKALTTAHTQLEIAQQKLEAYDGTSVTMLKIVSSIRSKAGLIHDVMKTRAVATSSNEGSSCSATQTSRRMRRRLGP